jgi:hypothetical protein
VVPYNAANSKATLQGIQFLSGVGGMVDLET